ncbi:MAG TPA: hypothetical protein VK427_11515, partial [Kofleriaceae bacterium]|nr:hypothetical protein [Kofleriaceae bacterium]
DGFRVDRVFAIGGELWVFGNGTLPYTAPEESEANAATDDDEDVDDEEDAEEEDADEEKAAIEVGEEDDDDEDDEYEEDEAEEEPNTLILSLADVGGAPVWIGASPVKPTHLCPLAGSGAISLQGYRCWHFPRAATAKVLFERRETRPDWNGLDGPREYVEGSDHNTSVPGDAACWVRRGNHLILQQPDALVIYAINPESPLATMAEE